MMTPANTDAQPKRCGYLVSGRVQGVGFRWWARKQAIALQIRGFVRNLSDGRVRVDAEGAQTALEEFVRLLKMGPPTSIVNRVDVVEPVAGPYPADFRIE